MGFFFRKKETTLVEKTKLGFRKKRNYTGRKNY